MTPLECASALGAAAARAANIQPVLSDFAFHMKGSINENFIAGGRPVAFAPVAMHPGHRAILIDTGALYDSSTAFSENGTDVVLVAGGGGQPAAKAPTLQYGANYTAKQRTAGTRGAGKFASKRTRKNIHRSAVTIPPRPTLLFQDEDIQYLGVRLPNYIFTITGAAPIVPSKGIF